MYLPAHWKTAELSVVSMPRDRAAMPRKKIDKLVDLAKTYGAKGLAYIAFNEDGTYKSSFAKFMTEEEMSSTGRSYGRRTGRSAAVCGR